MSEPGRQLTDWHFDCSVTFVTQQWTSSHKTSCSL